MTGGRGGVEGAASKPPRCMPRRLPAPPAQSGCADPQAAAPADGSRDNDERQRVGSATEGGASQQLDAEPRCSDAVALVEAIRKF